VRLAGAWLLAASCAAAASDWPQFLGPARDGRSPDRVLVPGWLERGLRERWRTPVGEGYSGLAVAGDRLVSMDSDGSSEFVFARAVADGREVWRVKLGPSPRDVYGGLGPRVTPTCDRGVLYLTTAELDLVALRVDTGRELWRQSLGRAMGARAPAEGNSASVLVEGDRLFAVVGGASGRSAAAFDRATGRLLWSALDDRASYSSPVALTLGGRRQVLFLTATHLRALEPETGRLLWSHPWPTRDGVNAATPIHVPPDGLFISSAYDQGAALLRIASAGPSDSTTAATRSGAGSAGSASPARDAFAATEVWRSKAMKNHFNNSVLLGSTLYGFDGFLLKAVDTASGRALWAERGFGEGSLISAGDHLVVLGEDGELALVRADPARLDVRARLPVLNGRCWTPPALAGGRLYLRNAREMVALEGRP
jgi:outer membrane protein assembly factor BamB